MPFRDRLPLFLRDLIGTRETPATQRAPVLWRRDRRARRESTAHEQRSLFGEILDFMFAPLVLLWPLSVAVTFIAARTLADAPYDRALVERTEVLAQQVRASPDQVVFALPRAARDLQEAEEPEREYLQVLAGDGKLIAGEFELPRPALYDFPEFGLVKIRNDTFRGDELRIGYLYVDPSADGDGSGPRLVQVAEKLDKRTRLANEIIKGVIFPQFLILPIAVVLVWIGLTRGLAPLQSLQTRIRGRRPDDLSPIDPRGAPEEIAPLIDAFNELLARLGQNISAQKRFVADAAHQMKTPLAGLRTQAELALRESDPAELRRTLEQLATGSQRTAHLISQLLALARTEYLRGAVPLETLDLIALARDIVEDWVPRALARSIDFGFECTGNSAPISGHPLLLRELMNNLIDNALRHTPAGGAVTVRVCAREREVDLEVEDSGPGIPESERGLIFERFYRVLDSEGDGSGLGLAIVREIAEQHAATIAVHWARSDPTHPGARFELRFARAAGPLPVAARPSHAPKPSLTDTIAAR
ncbi:MAG TPA: sensor histidine kinase N-terminal domain-containing protein [Burkholderiaceae bacterium]|nr:sensor histidine kinase N-terminal domain-containing protein [Burkholderiaceae bacterium]